MVLSGESLKLSVPPYYQHCTGSISLFLSASDVRPTVLLLFLILGTRPELFLREVVLMP